MAIKLEGEGPAIFTQERIGKDGKVFHVYKFRTMKADVPKFAYSPSSAEDTRVSRIGRFLRRTSLDEIPQFINVLKGDMSIVGPRPSIPYEFEHFLPHQRKRCDTLPGLTGLWQVKGKNRTTFEQMIDLDLDYVRRKSPTLDLGIIFMTVPAMVVQAWQIKTGRLAADQNKPVADGEAKKAA
jgi:lipopolysaccharide/colanic/teichoic acid biosynthesis glycosyltransferase